MHAELNRAETEMERQKEEKKLLLCTNDQLGQPLRERKRRDGMLSEKLMHRVRREYVEIVLSVECRILQRACAWECWTLPTRTSRSSQQSKKLWTCVAFLPNHQWEDTRAVSIRIHFTCKLQRFDKILDACAWTTYIRFRLWEIWHSSARPCNTQIWVASILGGGRQSSKSHCVLGPVENGPNIRQTFQNNMKF